MAAIYMWPVDEQILLTTTLYPVEAIEGMSLQATPTSSGMYAVLYDKAAATHDTIEGSYTQIRWFYNDGPYLDYLESTHQTIEGTYVQIRWFYEDGPYPDQLSATHETVDATHGLKLVTADSPDEKVQLTCTPNTSTMELI